MKKRDDQNTLSALIAINKPLGMSSHDCVSRARRLLHMKRVGHAGTLDPDASGVLVLGIGPATRLLGLLTLDTKSYDARIKFGAQTNTDDAQGEVICEADVPEELKSTKFARSILADLVGVQMQVPPQFSAISINGVRSYKAARAGEHVEIPPREIEIYEARLNEICEEDGLVWDVSFTVSKGTYIRSIARDLGEKLGTKAHLCGLCRTNSGNIKIEDALTFDLLESLGPECIEEHAIDPIEALGVRCFKEMTDDDIADAACGKRIAQDGVQGGVCKPGELVALVKDQRLYGIWEPCERGRLKAKVNFSTPVAGVKYPC